MPRHIAIVDGFRCCQEAGDGPRERTANIMARYPSAPVTSHPIGLWTPEREEAEEPSRQPPTAGDPT